jgi:hypothetical protein
MYYIYEHRDYWSPTAGNREAQNWFSDMNQQVSRALRKAVATSGHATYGYGYSVIRHPQT